MDLEREIRASLSDGKLKCAAAWEVAERAGVARLEVGETADHLDIRVSHCQLGLFGYGEKRLGEHKIVRPAETLEPAMADSIRAAAHDGKVTCEQLFEIAGQMGKPGMAACAHAEALGFKIHRCQLGCFP